MALHRYLLRPLAPWGTPMRSDTLAGLLLFRLAEDEGEEVLRAELAAFREGKPPFAVSSVMPANTVFAPKLPPIPRKRFAELVESGFFRDGEGRALTKLQALGELKKFRKKAWLPLPVWEQHRGALSFGPLFAEFCRNPSLWDVPTADRHQEMHVTIARNSSTALEGGLFVDNSWWPRTDARYHLYAETEDSPRLLARLANLGAMGFGRDSSTGKGVFSVEEDATFAPWSGELPHGLLLSMLAAKDMKGLDGWYAVDVKVGKAGPGISRGNPYKSPFMCVREGAVLTSLPKGPFVLEGLNANPEILQVTQPLLLGCRLAEEEDNA